MKTAMEMLDKVEFYNCPDGSVNVKPDNGPVFPYDMKCRHITEEMLLKIKELYPDAFSALSEMYSKSERNREYFEFRIVQRFIRCNFGEYDALSFDIDKHGSFNFENVKCPLRGECRHEGIICMPKMQSKLSEREMEVAKLLKDGCSAQDIADELCISVYTVNRHVANIKARLGIKKSIEIMKHVKFEEP